MSGSWTHSEGRGLGPFDAISAALAADVAQGKTLLPNLRAGTTLFLTSDYGGSHGRATHETYSFLFSDPTSMGRWHAQRTSIRGTQFGHRRRMSYKGLGDGRKNRVLPEFLCAANQLPGLLASVVVSKRCGTLFEGGNSSPEIVDMLGRWKPAVRERLLRILAFASFFLAGVSRSGQDVLWFTDEDDIAPNPQRLGDGARLFGHVASHFLSHDLRHLRFGTAKSDNGDLSLEDLLAVPDLVTGALADLWELKVRDGLEFSEHLVTSVPLNLPSKARRILSWHGQRAGLPLRTLIYFVEPTKAGGISWKRLHTHVIESP
jgi:hypothetical protein